MSRRDTIIIAVLINTGLLGILFMMAINVDEDRIIDPTPEIQNAIVEASKPLPQFEPIAFVEPKPLQPPRDELDSVIQNYAQAEKAAQPKIEAPVTLKEEYVEITVKRGDSLDKIARANGTTISTIMAINHLTHDRIEIGQVLNVPVNSKKQTTVSKPEPKVEASEPEYYTMQNGDNPWKIAKKFRVRFDELLKLNQLDEEKARRLKPGDKIRVR